MWKVLTNKYLKFLEVVASDDVFAKEKMLGNISNLMAYIELKLIYDSSICLTNFREK